MLRWCFVLPNVQATERHTQTQAEHCGLIFAVCLADSRQTCRHEGLKIKKRLGVLLISETKVRYKTLPQDSRKSAVSEKKTYK